MRDAVVLFVWLLALAVLAAVIALVWLWIWRYVFMPLPYHDPEPPITSADLLTRFR
jgi:hypothetical protein